MANVDSFLNKPMGDIERPPPLPAGRYLARVVSFDATKKARQSQNDQVEFVHELLSPIEVDQEALIASKVKFPAKMRSWFTITEASAHYLKTFLTRDLKIEENLTLGEALSESPNKQFVATVSQQPSNRVGDTGMVSNVSGYEPLEE